MYGSPNSANISVAGHLPIEVKRLGEGEACACLIVKAASRLRDVDGPLCERKNKCRSKPSNYICMNRESLR